MLCGPSGVLPQHRVQDRIVGIPLAGKGRQHGIRPGLQFLSEGQRRREVGLADLSIHLIQAGAQEGEEPFVQPALLPGLVLAGLQGGQLGGAYGPLPETGVVPQKAVEKLIKDHVGAWGSTSRTQ